MSKPVVTFKKFNRWEDYANGRTAVLEGIEGHPRLGNPHIVYTSLVEKVVGPSDNPIIIVTRNTVYQKDM